MDARLGKGFGRGVRRPLRGASPEECGSVGCLGQAFGVGQASQLELGVWPGGVEDGDALTPGPEPSAAHLRLTPRRHSGSSSRRPPSSSGSAPASVAAPCGPTPELTRRDGARSAARRGGRSAASSAGKWGSTGRGVGGRSVSSDVGLRVPSAMELADRMPIVNTEFRCGVCAALEGHLGALHRATPDREDEEAIH